MCGVQHITKYVLKQWFFKAAGQYFFSKRRTPFLFEVKAHKAHKLKDTQDTESKQKALRKDKANRRAPPGLKVHMPHDWNYIEANNYRTLQRSKAPFVYCKIIGQQYEPWRPACDFSLFLDPEKNKDHIPAKAKIVWKWRHWQIFLQRCCHSKKLGWTWLHQRPARAHQGVCNTLLIIIIPSRKIKNKKD